MSARHGAKWWGTKVNKYGHCRIYSLVRKMDQKASNDIGGSQMLVSALESPRRLVKTGSSSKLLNHEL